MISRILILCGGKGTRWGDFLNVPKQMLALTGEPLLHRTVRQFRAAVPGVPITVISRDLSAPGVPSVDPLPGDLNTDKFASSLPLWGGTGSTLFVHGDVFFESKDVTAIVAACADRSLWFGNMRFYELLASYVAADEMEAWINVMRHVLNQERNQLTAGGAWRMLRLWNKLPAESEDGTPYPFPNYPTPLLGYLDCPGLSRDFDYPEDLVRWLTLVGNEKLAAM